MLIIPEWAHDGVKEENTIRKQDAVGTWKHVLTGDCEQLNRKEICLSSAVWGNHKEQYPGERQCSGSPQAGKQDGDLDLR